MRRKIHWSASALTLMIALSFILAPAFQYEAMARSMGVRMSSPTRSVTRAFKTPTRSTSVFRTTSATTSKPTRTVAPSRNGWFGGSAKSVKTNKQTQRPAGTTNRGFASTSKFSDQQIKNIRTQNAMAAKKAQKDADAKFTKKPTVATYTPATLPKTATTSPVYTGYRLPRTYNYSDRQSRTNDYFGRHKYDPHRYDRVVVHSSPSFGMLDTLGMLYLVDTIHDRNSLNAMRSMQQMDPNGYKQWHDEMMVMAATNADLKAQLALADAELNKAASTPIDTEAAKNVPASVVMSSAAIAAIPKDSIPLRLYTGPKDGNYFLTGLLVDKAAKDITVINQDTAGSGKNIEAFVKGEADAIILQQDIYDMYKSTFELTDARAYALMNGMWLPLYVEPFQLIASKSSKVKTMDDLKPTNVVYVGLEGSGSAISYKKLMTKNPGKFPKPTYLCKNKAIKLVERNPNAVLFTVCGLNSKFLKGVEGSAGKTGLRLIDVDNEEFYAMTGSDGYQLYKRITVPRSNYPNLQDGFIFNRPVNTPGTNAIILVSPEWSKKYGQGALSELQAAILAARNAMLKRVGEL